MLEDTVIACSFGSDQRTILLCKPQETAVLVLQYVVTHLTEPTSMVGVIPPAPKLSPSIVTDPDLRGLLKEESDNAGASYDQPIVPVPMAEPTTTIPCLAPKVSERAVLHSMRVALLHAIVMQMVLSSMKVAVVFNSPKPNPLIVMETPPVNSKLVAICDTIGAATARVNTTSKINEAAMNIPSNEKSRPAVPVRAEAVTIT
jgi:hypothetical protein